MRTDLLIALLALVVSAGCVGPIGDGPAGDGPTSNGPATTATAETTLIPEPVTTPTGTATGELPTTAERPTTRTTETRPGTGAEPQKGDQFLSVTELNESEALAWNSSARAAFENLSAERRRVVSEAVECDCGVELDGEFDFNDKSRVEVVAYDGTYYFLRVTIV